jgi:hypothetical protein
MRGELRRPVVLGALELRRLLLLLRRLDVEGD